METRADPRPGPAAEDRRAPLQAPSQAVSQRGHSGNRASERSPLAVGTSRCRERRRADADDAAAAGQSRAVDLPIWKNPARGRQGSVSSCPRLQGLAELSSPCRLQKLSCAAETPCAVSAGHAPVRQKRLRPSRQALPYRWTRTSVQHDRSASTLRSVPADASTPGYSAASPSASPDQGCTVELLPGGGVSTPSPHDRTLTRELLLRYLILGDEK